MIKTAQKEAKRLRKSVKRRRGYAENLRNSVNELRATAQVSGNEDDAHLAERLDEMANAELTLAREEEARAKEIESQPRAGCATALFGSSSSAEHRERSDRAMATMSGSFARDRIHYLLAHHKLEPTGDNHLDLGEIEKRLELTDQVNPKGGPRMQIGRRIALAETATFGAPRF